MFGGGCLVSVNLYRWPEICGAPGSRLAYPVDAGTVIENFLNFRTDEKLVDAVD
jgi:hypothetical protein